MKTRFAWAPAKARRNLRDHGVSFEEAVELFSDPHQIVSENYYVAEDGEQRFQIIGMAAALTLLLMVFVDRSGDGEEVI